MKPVFTSETAERLLIAAHGSILELYVDRAVGKLFKSTKYITSRRVADCAVLLLLFYDDFDMPAVGKVTAFINGKSRAFYSAIEHELKSTDNGFLSHATEEIDGFETIAKSDIRAADLVVYAVARYVLKHFTINRDEVIMRAFSYKELSENNLIKD